MGKFEKTLIFISICFYIWLGYALVYKLNASEKAYIEKGYTKVKVCTQYTYNWELKDD